MTRRLRDPAPSRGPMRAPAGARAGGPAAGAAAGLARGAVFDLDGTLADTSGDLIAAANAALAAAGGRGRLDPARDQGVAGRGGRAMLTLGLARGGRPQEAIEAELDALVPVFLAEYAAGIAVRTRLFPGVLDCLDRLDRRGWTLAVCTNKPVGLAEPLLAALGVRDRFAAVLGADSLPVRKPDPAHLWETIDRAGAARDASVLIGDTVTDRMTARNAGAPCVLMDFGLSADDLAALEPDALLDGFDALPETLERLVSAPRTGAR